MSIAPMSDLTEAERLALKIVKKMLKNPDTLRSYNTMQNINRRVVMRELNAWAEERQLRPKTRDAIVKALDIKTRADFHGAMNRVIGHTKKWLAGEPYALIVEFSVYAHDPSEPSVWPKSSAWLAAPVIRGIGRPPAVIIPYFWPHEDHLNLYSHVSTTLLRRAIASGIRSFVHIDDAMYSGMQKSTVLQTLQRWIQDDGIALAKAQRAHLVGLQNAGWIHVRARTPDGQLPRLLIAAAFTTDAALSMIKTIPVFKNSRWMHVQVFAGGRLPTPHFATNIIENFENDTNYVPYKTLLPFKVPNHASFGPATLGARLEKVLPRPPYKRKKS